MKEAGAPAPLGARFSLSKPKQDSLGDATYRKAVICGGALLGGRWLGILVLCRARIKFENCSSSPDRICGRSGSRASNSSVDQRLDEWADCARFRDDAGQRAAGAVGQPGETLENGWRLASAPPLPCRATRPAAVDRAGLRLKLLKQQPEPGDIVLLSQDKPEALTHPWFGQAVGLGGPAGATGGQRAGAPARCYADPARPVDRLGQTVNDNPNSVEITAANINEIEIGRSVPIEASCT